MVDFRNRVPESIKSGRAIRLSDKQRWCVALAAIKLTAEQVDALEAENAQTVAETEDAEVAEATEAVEAEAEEVKAVEEVEGVETASAGEGGAILSGWGRTQKKARQSPETMPRGPAYILLPLFAGLRKIMKNYTNMQTEKKGWGGYRPGSGRKKRPEPSVLLAVRVSQEAADLFRATCDARGEAYGEALTRLILDGLGGREGAERPER